MITSSPDVAVIGAGPVGCVTALAYARSGAKVMLLEAQPNNTKRLAGEWLHPPGLQILENLGVSLSPLLVNYATGLGFVVFADDGNKPIQLNYPSGAMGFSCEHNLIVSTLRKAVVDCDGIDFITNARVTKIQGQQLTFQHHKHGETTIFTKGIVGADGRSSVARKALDIAHKPKLISYMAGVLLQDIELPFEGFGHVFLGGAGPALVYRIGENQVRMCLDVPLGFEKKPAHLWDAYSPILPSQLLRAFRKALAQNQVVWVANQYSSRTHYGRPGLALVGDATGYFHPMTATGMTVGFMDAECLVRSQSFDNYQRQRNFGTYVPEMLAMTLHQVFCGDSESAVAIRRAIYQMWRQEPQECVRTMHLLSGAQTNILHFSGSFLKGLAIAVKSVFKDNISAGKWRHLIQSLVAFGQWLRLPLVIALSRFHKHQRVNMKLEEIKDNSVSNDNKVSFIADNKIELSINSTTALERAVDSLLSHQLTNGSWEGEVVWCPMLPAQYVLMCYITQTPISSERRLALLKQLKTTRLSCGLWGLHEKSQPYLFVTTLIYVAARILGVEKEEPLLAPALEFIREQGGILAIPTWGKFWLAMLNVYDWRGVNPVLPEAWLLPKWIPAHPGNFYCHTRLIYMPMGFIYGRKFQVPVTPLIETLRSELYVSDYQQVNFSKARLNLRQEEVYNPPSKVLKLIYFFSNLYERWHHQGWRSKAIASMVDCIRFELQTTDYTSLSPVSGLLNIIALWLYDSNDADIQRALKRFEGWIWQDERNGLRITGARSSTWDTGFAIQALQAASPHVDVSTSLLRGQQFLATQQIPTTFPNIEHFHRINPKGGFCFAGVWHGWPVSDCTAEALLGLLDAPPEIMANCNLHDAVEFILRCQNSDGGFGSYERRKIRSTLEWMNPAEMFANSMTEHSYIECTASCLMALRKFCDRYPEIMNAEIDIAIQRAGLWLRQQQKPDGSWLGFWGVNFIYGTMFGIHGLLAATNNTNDAAIHKACDWLISKQKQDGGWGEHFQGCLSGEYIENTESQVTQTAWAMMGLLKAGSNHWEEINRGASFLIDMQLENGTWEKQDMSGVFFHTALLDYTLYRSYFPVWALSLYESRRQERLSMRKIEQIC
ncbi:MAG: FAD-dependent monooxygenase [Rivularia sp. (in: Bacteria)]|nr:FAD-dependent monooxygenase [Rivularia sp. MS3]